MTDAGGGGLRGEQSEETALTDDVALLVELLDADVVEVLGAVDGGAGVGLGEHQHVGLAGLGADLRGQGRETAGGGRVHAQDAQAGAGLGAQRLVAVLVGDQGVLAVPHEGEVAVGEPAQELDALADLAGVDPAGDQTVGVGGDLVGDPDDPVAHLGGVLVHLADVAEDGLQPLGDLLDALGIALPVDLDVHPGLVEGQQVVAADLGVDLAQSAGHVTADGHLGVDDDPNPRGHLGQGHGHGGDQEGSVVGDDLDDAGLLLPTVPFEVGGVDPDLGAPLGTFGAEGQVGGGGPADLLGAAAADLLRVRVPVVEGEQAADLVGGLGAQPCPGVPSRGRVTEQLLEDDVGLPGHRDLSLLCEQRRTSAVKNTRRV